MTPLDHALLLLRQLARWPRVTILVSACLLTISVYQGIEAGMPPALTALSSIAFLSVALLFKGLFLFAPYKSFHGELFDGSYLLIAVLLATLWLPFVIGGFLVLMHEVHAAEGPPGWFLALSTLVIVLFCWVVMRTGIKRSSD